MSGFNCHAALIKTLESDCLLSIVKVDDKKRKQASALQSKDVLIVGAGRTLLGTIKKTGYQNILVVDREPEAGGMPRMCHHTGFGREDLWRMWSGPKYAKYYRDLAEKWDVEVQTSTTILGWNGLSKLNFTSPNGLGEIEAQAILLATGVRERPRSARIIPGTRPQGIYTTGSLQQFVYQEKLPSGEASSDCWCGVGEFICVDDFDACGCQVRNDDHGAAASSN